MRPRSRATKVTPRRVLPERSRLTVRRTVAALRRSREALVDIESQLGDLLVRVRSSGTSFDGAVMDRLAGAKTRAVAAMSELHPSAGLFG
jgi:hypothetical protein